MTINELLDLSPQERKKIPLTELKRILEPYYPIVRKAQLPEDNYKKIGVTASMLKQFLATDPATIARLREARNK